MSGEAVNGLGGIAIIGMAGRFPRARDLAEFWRNLRDGVDCVSSFRDEELAPRPPAEVLRNPSFVKARAVLDDVDLFDAPFFDIPPRQAELMDPQHRLFLETAWHALEDAGYDPERVAGTIGVFGGVTLSSYFLANLLGNPELLAAVGSYQVAIGTDRDYLTTLASYKLNLRGPSLDVQTACSTSLVATILACQSLLSYGCDLALAGGVSVKVPQKSGYLYQPGGLDSSDGRCRAFDARADGSVYGSGVGVVVLKRLEDALTDGDAIESVILGGALNNDGAAKVGFTAPGVEGQAEVIAQAQALAGVDPATIGYVECHGSGTALGDPIEVAALTRAFRAGATGDLAQGFCAIGSVKSNIGHCSAAAGIAGLIKASLSLAHRQIPPSLHFERPNPAIDFANSPFRVSDRLADWLADGEPRRAGVSSFGLGGTNAHVVLEEAPTPEPSGPSRPWQLLLLSARSEAALERMTDNLAADLEAHPERPLADVAFTLQAGRRIFSHRRLLVCRDAADARQALTARDPRRLLGNVREPGRRPLAFLLPGVGDHYPGMAQGLYESEPVFREHFDRCVELLAPRLGIDLRTVVFPGDRPAGPAGPDLRRMLGRSTPGETDRRLNRTLYAQPAVFAVEYALARLWMEWGVRPEALLGYSLGEYVAACLAGVLSLEDALALVAERARLIDGLPAGAMLAVPLAEERVRELIAGSDLDLSAVNAPEVCVVAGPESTVADLEERLVGEGVPFRRLPTTHAFHSRMMAPVAPALTRLARGLTLAPPKIPYVSNVTGTWITHAEATDPESWARHLLQPVRFAAGVALLGQGSPRVLLEVGPGFGLSSLALQQPVGPVGPMGEAAERVALPSLRHEHDAQPDQAFLLTTLGRLWLAGVEVDWAGFYARERRRRVRLPLYPFERIRYWVEPKPWRGAADDGRFALPGGERVSFERALEMAREGTLTLVEDSATLTRLARLRELEALGARIEAPAAPEEPSGKSETARHTRPGLSNAHVPPASAAEQHIARLFEALLGLEGVGRHDSFFELGGHSLLGTSLLARLREAFGVELPLATLFAEPTVAGLAAAVEAAERTRGELPPPLVPVPRSGEEPLSYSQQRLWFLDRLMPGNPFYNLSGGVRLTGSFDLRVLRASVNELVRRHETLRTGFVDLQGRPAQRIVPAVDVAIPVIDLTALAEGEREDVARRLARDLARAPFDLSRPGLLRIAVLRMGSEPAEHVLLYAVHHIVSDGWSMALLVGEIAALFAAFAGGEPSPLPELPIQYADFAAWQRSWLTGDALERQLAYWRRQLAGAPGVELPADRPRPPLQSFRGATLRVVYGGPILGALNALALRHDASLFMVLLGAFQVLLARVTGQDDVVVGTPIANRKQRELEGLIGFFVNTLVLRTGLEGDPDFASCLGRVKEVCLGAYAHQDLPFEQLVEELQPRRDLSRNPLFQVMFNLLNAPPARSAVAGDLVMSPLPPPQGVSLFDLQAYATETPGGLAVSWEHSTDLFDATTILRLSRCFETLLAGIAARPEARILDLPLLAEAERHQLVHGWNDTAASFPGTPCLHRLIEEQVRRTPEAVAVTCDGRRLTYAEMNARANRLARHLRSLGCGPEARVAVALERSPELVVALLGVLKAGAAYVPLDPDYPRERLAYMLEDSRPAVLLTQPSLRGLLPGSTVPMLCLETDGSESAAWSAEDLDRLLDDRLLAYVIYTSGSTGRPKGAMVHHRGIRNRLLWMQEAYALEPQDTVLQKTPFSFDVSVWEFFWPLLTGARLAVALPGEHRDAAALGRRIHDEGVTVLHFVPSMLQAFLETPGVDALCPAVRLVVASGEALPADLERRFFERLPQARLENLYGPTEASVDVTFHRCSPAGGRTVPIGRPMANTRIHLLDHLGGLVPVGAPGELAIGGVHVGRGYLDRPDLTAERFVPDPFEPGARLYRTGDLARHLPDGTIEFLGRIDHQVKLRGIRIELGEIEAVIAEDPAVLQAVAMVREDTPGDQRLVAYVVPREPGATSRLRDALRERIPAHMVPSVFVEMEALPLTPSGKVDRRALPAPDGGRPVGERPYVAPRTPTETVLAGIWQALLKVEAVGRDDDFFSLGGHSLLATQMVARVRDALQVELPLPAVFQEPALSCLAERIDRECGRGAPAPAGIQPRRRDRGLDELKARVEGLSDAEVEELLRRRKGSLVGSPSE